MGKRRDLSGQKFGRLIVIEPAEDVICKNGKPKSRWKCVCDCGNEKIVYGENLTAGYTQSCGCIQRARASEATKTHGDSSSRLYAVWCAIKQRCMNENSKHYNKYGGRGITICDEWTNDFSLFKEWANLTGYDEHAPRGECTIDRIDNNKGYYPDNCRWVNQETQMNNVSYNRYITYQGVQYTLSELAKAHNIDAAKLRQRIDRYGYSVEKALTKQEKQN